MKTPIKTIKTKTFLLLFLLFVGTGAIAQGPGFPGSGPDGTGQQDEAPISSLVIVGLIAGGLIAGAAYGYKKLK